MSLLSTRYVSRTLALRTLHAMLTLHTIPTHSVLSTPPTLSLYTATSLQAQEPRALLPDAMRAECARVMVTEADGNLVQGSKLQAPGKPSKPSKPSKPGKPSKPSRSQR